METISTAFLFMCIAICLIIEMYLYKKYSIRVDVSSHPRTFLYKLQISITFLLPLLAIARLVLQATVLYDKVVYNYMILVLVLNIFLWPASIWIVIVERCYALPSIPTFGHSLGLLLFWTCAFIVENLSFLNLRNESWWFGRKR